MEKPIGILIKEELERQERTVTWFAKKLNCHRVNVYDIFSRENIDIQLLIRISRILNKNYLRELANDYDNNLIIDM